MNPSQRGLRPSLRPRSHHFPLEARQLFDGAAVVEAAAAHPDAPAAAPAPAPDAHPAPAMPDAPAAHAPAEPPHAANDTHAGAPAPEAAAPRPVTPDAAPAASEAAAAAHAVYVIDKSVDQWQALAAQLPPGSDVILLDGGSAGSAQLAQALAGRTDVSALHILSHGSADGIMLGNEELNAASLAGSSAQAAEWRAIGAALTADADILLYGCDAAQGTQGQAFIDRLAALTQADVAGSSNPTGAASRGGDWTLERSSGHIEAAALAGLAYDGLLAAPTITDAVATTRTTAEDTPLVLGGVTVGDADGGSLTATFTVTGGTLTLAGSGWSITGGADHSSTVTITGSIASINSALAGLQFNPTLNQNSQVTGYASSLAISVTDGSTTANRTIDFSVTPQNDAPYLGGGVPRVLNEGGSAALSLQQLAVDSGSLDADIASGQQVLEQQMMRVDSLPAHGTLTYLGGPVLVGSVIPVSHLSDLVYTHDGSDISSQQSDSFNVTVNDGGGNTTAGTVALRINPVNVAPAFNGAVSLYEGQIKSVMPAFTLGDAFDTPANSTITVNSVTTGGQGVFFFDANDNNVYDAGDTIVTGAFSFAASDAAKFKFVQDGSEPNGPAAVAPSFSVTLADAGGGTGVAATTTTTVTLDVIPNNDDPTLDTNLHPPATPLAVDERSTTLITGAMLHISDADLDPANPSQPWPDSRLAYTLASVPTNGELQLFVGGAWRIMAVGSRFTQDDLANNRVRYVQTQEVEGGATDNFTFTVRDSAYGYDLSDPAVVGPLREGADRTGSPVHDSEGRAVFTFALSIADTVAPGTGTGPGPSALTTGFVSGGANNADAANWDEANLSVSGVIDTSMLQWTISHKDGATVIDTVPPDETVYTLTALPANGVLQRQVSAGVWATLAAGSVFTQADIDSGNIRFVHDGGEQFVSSFGYKVSDGNQSFDGTFAIDVDPINDRPDATGGSVIVREKVPDATPPSDGVVRLTSGAIGMSDVDLAVEVSKRTGEGAADFLWFKISDMPDHGEIQRWTGAAWVAVGANEWLASTLLTASADGGTSGLRYVHDGSEPLAYAGGPSDGFKFVVRDDLAAPGSVFDVDTSTPADTTGSAQSNQSAEASVHIGIVPVNNRPLVADKPGDADPVLTGGVIAGGGATTGANNPLAVAEGSSTVITSAFLTAVDPDSTTVQRQFRLTQLPVLGDILLDGKVLGVGSTFTQADIDNGKVVYRHRGAEAGAATTDAFGTYNDKFHFIVDDAISADAGADSNNNVFLITLDPANDAPVVSGPGAGTTILTDTNHAVPGFSVADPDLVSVDAGEVDFLQVTVRLLDHTSGNPLADYTGVTIGVAGLAGIGTHTGNGTYLTIQGTRAQVNTALAGLTVAFADDRDVVYDVQVIADDRVRDGTGALVDRGGGNPGGNGGGTQNEPLAATGPGPAFDVPGTDPDWATATVPAPTDPLAGNISAKIATIATSQVNQPATLGATTHSITTYEDQATLIGGTIDFAVADPESEAFNTPITVTLSVGSGTLTVGSAAGVSVGGSGGTITVTGRADLVEGLLNSTLRYRSATNLNHDTNGGAAGDVTLTVTLDDAGSRFGSGGASVVSGSPQVIDITIQAVNDAPTVTVGSGTLAVTSTTPVDGFSVGDIDITDSGGVTTGESDFIQVTLRITDAAGVPIPATSADPLVPAHTDAVIGSTAAGSSGATVDATYGGNGTALVVRGTQAQVNAYLAGLEVTFSGALLNSDDNLHIEMVADDRMRDAAGVLDGSNAANGGLNADGANGAAEDGNTLPDNVPATAIDPYAAVPANLTANVTVGARLVFPTTVNDPATINATSFSVDEAGGTVLLGSLTSNIVLADPDDLGRNTMTVTVSVPAGFSITDVNGEPGITGLGTSSVTFSGTEAELNTRLQHITVTLPDPAGPATSADYSGTFTVTVVYNDQGNTGLRPGTLPAGSPSSGDGQASYEDGSSNHLVTTRTFDVTINPTNDAPVVGGTASNPVFTEDATTGAPQAGTPVHLMTPGASVFDSDLPTTAGLVSTVFGDGSITVRFPGGYQPGDTLFVDLPSLPPGVSVTGGAGADLVIDLAPGTTVAEVNALLDAIAYVSGSDDPSAGGTAPTRAYTIVINDNSNDQGGGHTAGSGGALDSNVIAGTITMAVANDPPVAVDDTNSITEDTVSVGGNVIANDRDPDSTPLSVTGIRTGTEVSPVGPVTGTVGVPIAGLYGTLTLNANGSYTYVLDNANPAVNALRTGEHLTEVFTYTLSEPPLTGLTDTAQLTITIDGVTDLAIGAVDTNGGATGHNTVYEAGLTSPGDTRETTTGSIVVGAPLGLQELQIGGTTVTPGELAGLGTTPVVIDTGEGILTLTGFTDVDPGPGVDAVLTYSYLLKAPLPQPGATDSTDVVELRVVQTGGSFSDGTLTVQIVDDTPAANPDGASIQLGGGAATVGGNILGGAGQGPGDQADRVGADATGAPITAFDFGGTAGTLGTPLAATYGSLVLQANGQYTYVLNTEHPAVKNLASGLTLTETFNYTITDADGDTATATLVITIRGPDASIPQGDQIFGNIIQNDPPVIYQPFEPAVFVQVSVADSARQSQLLSAQMADGEGIAFGDEIQSDLLGIAQDMTNAQHVSRDGVAFSIQLANEGQSRARSIGNSLVVGAQSLFDDFSPFGPNPQESGGDAQGAQQSGASADAAPERSTQLADAAGPHTDGGEGAHAPHAGPERSAAAASFSAQLLAMAGARGSVRDMSMAALAQKHQPVKVARATSRI